jgi:hypothetical protein
MESETYGIIYAGLQQMALLATLSHCNCKLGIMYGPLRRIDDALCVLCCSPAEDKSNKKRQHHRLPDKARLDYTCVIE